MCIDLHLQSGNVSIYWLWLLLGVSAVSVVIVIIAISDMPIQEISLCERMYIFTICIWKAQSRVLKHGTNSKWSFQDDLCLIPVQLGDRLKDKKKKTGSIKNRKVNCQCHVLTEETLDEIGERNWTEITVSIWEQCQYVVPLVGKPASQGCEWQLSVAARSIWEALYNPFMTLGNY